MSDVNKTQTGTVTLVGGVAEVRYKIKSPKVNQSAAITCTVNDPMNLRKYDVIDLSTLPGNREPDLPPVTYTISASKNANNVTFTIKSVPTTSVAPVSLTMTEYRPGNPRTVVKTQTAVVSMSNGTGSTVFAISQGSPAVDQKVEGKLTDIPAVKTEVTVPRYVAPQPVPPTYPWVSVKVNGGSGASVRGNITGTISWGGFTTSYHSGIQARVDVYRSNGSKVNGVWTLSGLNNPSGPTTSDRATVSGTYNFSWPYDASAAGSKAKVEVYAGYGAMTFPNGSSVNGSNSRDYIITV